MHVSQMLVKMRDATLSNPFVIDGPITNDGMFVGRDLGFQWLSDEISTTPSLPPLAIEGPEGIGKTSFLKQIYAGRLGDSVVPIYLDIKELPFENLTEFLWALAKITMAGLERRSIDGPTMEKRLLILRPWQAFNHHFWHQLTKSAGGRSILFLVDNFDEVVASEFEDRAKNINRNRLFELFQSDHQIVVFFSLKGRIEAYDPQNLAPFDIARSYRLSFFTHQETNELLIQAMSFPVFTDLSTFIHDLTSGHPGDLQRLGHALHEYGSSRRLRQITLVDVLAVLENQLQPKVFHTAVHRRRDELSLQYPREALID
jgi:hypothetical protein